MEFVYHHRTQGRGGEGVHIAGLVRALEACGHRVVLASPPGVDPLATAARVPTDKGAQAQRGIRRVWAWVSRRGPQWLFEALELAYNVFAVARLAPLLRRPGVIYYERYAFFHVAGVLLARLYGRPVMVEINEVAGVDRARRQVLVRLARWAERVVLLRADAVLVVSSFLRDEVVSRGAPPARVHVLPNAVDAAWLDERSGASRVRRRHGLDASLVLGFVGWFDDWDRLDLLVDVLDELRGRHARLALLLVGSGPAAERLRRDLRLRPVASAVTLAGPVPRDEVPDYIDAMDICVLADSNPFGSPIVLFEFMARAKPVVAAALAPMRDVIEHGRSGWLVAPADRRELAGAIERLIEDEPARQRLGRNARNKVRRDHTWQANGRRVARLAAELRSGARAA